MLNEHLEYEQYTYDIRNSETPAVRLKYFYLIKNQFTGVSRALEIIARHFLFDLYPERTQEERIDVARIALNAWLGFGEKADCVLPEVEAIRNWLPDYIRYVACEDNSTGTVNRCKSTDAAEKAIADLKSKASSWKRKLFVGDVDLNQISIERSIANALRMGALQEYVLVCRKAPMWEKDAKNKRRKTKPGDQPTVAGNRERILKLTAACLLELNRRDDRDAVLRTNPAVHVTAADVWNWCKVKKPPSRTELQKWKAAGKPVVYRTNLLGGEIPETRAGIAKFRLGDEWLSDYGWRIIQLTGDMTAESLCKSNEWACVYADRGTEELLRINSLTENKPICHI